MSARVLLCSDFDGFTLSLSMIQVEPSPREQDL